MKVPNKSIASDLAHLQDRIREGQDRIEQSAIKAEDLKASIRRAKELQNRKKQDGEEEQS